MLSKKSASFVSLFLGVGISVLHGGMAGAQTTGPTATPAATAQPTQSAQPGAYGQPGVFPQQQVYTAPQNQQPPQGPQTPQAQVQYYPPVGQPMQVPALPSAVGTKPGEGLPKEVFGAIVNEKYPLSPSQVKQLNGLVDQIERASSARSTPAPTPTNSTTRVSFAAGSGPQVVRVSAGTVSSLIFTDISGSPWIVQRVVAGRPKLLDLTYGKMDGPSNMFTINPLSEQVSTNIAVFLEGAPAPIVMAVESGQKAVDFRLDVSVQARGPQATDPAISRGFVENVPAELNDMVAGVTPKNAKPLKISASDISDVQAWVVGNRMFVRSRAVMLAPAPIRVATGADGTKVFELPHASQVLMSANGSPGRVTLTGFPPPALASVAGASTGVNISAAAAAK